MARGWYGNSAGHAQAGQLGGKKSAENRRVRSQFGEQLTSASDPKKRLKRTGRPDKPQAT